MNRHHNSDEFYPIPSVFYPSYSMFFIGTLLIIDGLFLYIVYLFISSGKSFDLGEVTVLMLWPLIILLLHVDFVHAQILRRQYLELNEKGVLLKTFFTKKFMGWEEIDFAEVVRGSRGFDGLIIRSVTKYNPYPKVDKLGIKRDLKYSNISTSRFVDTVERFKSPQVND